jgi:aspartate aminotransferase-like enzyme
MCGAFSDKWFDVSKKCGKQAEALQVEWGSPIRAEAIDKKLATGEFDALTLIHNETSTGVMSPLAEIAALKKKYPDVMFIVDAVSSLTALPIKFDELGMDVLLAGTQPRHPPRSRKRPRPKIADTTLTSWSSRRTPSKA